MMSIVPVPVLGIKEVQHVSAGALFSCAIFGDETVGCWGQAGDGKLGNDVLKNIDVPSAVLGLGGIVSLASGTAHSCAVDRTGAVHCWGPKQERSAWRRHRRGGVSDACGYRRPGGRSQCLARRHIQLCPPRERRRGVLGRK